MEISREQSAPAYKDKSGFKWTGLAVLLVGINVALRALADLAISGPLLIFLIIASISLLLVFFRQYDWRNFTVALLLICTIYPVRFIFHWWLNPVVYGLAALECLLLLVRFIRRSGWKQGLTVLLVICVLLTSWQAAISASEVGQCYVDDIRWTHHFYCESTGGQYQQIESLPIGMQGYCYFCPWYRGVSR